MQKEKDETEDYEDDKIGPEMIVLRSAALIEIRSTILRVTFFWRRS